MVLYVYIIHVKDNLGNRKEDGRGISGFAVNRGFTFTVFVSDNGHDLTLLTFVGPSKYKTLELRLLCSCVTY